MGEWVLMEGVERWLVKDVVCVFFLLRFRGTEINVFENEWVCTMGSK